MLRIRYVAAAILCLPFALLVSSCVAAPPETDPGEVQSSNGPEPTEDAQQSMVYVGSPYDSKDFPFVVERKWDGQDGAGGWQRARVSLLFVIRREGLPVYDWKCPLDITMAVQSRLKGHIPPTRAARVTGEIATVAVHAVAATRADWEGQGEAFCGELRETMKKLFGSDKYGGYGARVAR